MLIIVYGLVLAIQCVVFLTSWSEPLLEQHGFRQTQTAISVYWGIREGWHLAYLTPVFGAPWSVPFEFPLFQWLVSCVWWLTRLPLDTCGRLTSFLFHLGCSGLVIKLLRRLGSSRLAAYASASAFLLAPVNFFWGRAFLIESCALFFSLWYLTTLVDAFPPQGEHPKASPPLWHLPIAILVATAAGLVKITTFVIPLALGGVLAMSWWIAHWHREKHRGMAGLRRFLAWFVLPSGTAIVVTYLWISFSDAVKAQNEIATTLRGSHLMTWTFGTAAMRLSSTLWLDTIWSRSVSETIGHVTFVLLLMAIPLVRSRRVVYYAMTFLAAYVGVFLLLPNLHIVHNYYQYSTAVWLICAAGMVLSAVGERSIVIFFVIVLVMFTQQTLNFSKRYLPLMRQTIEPMNNRTLAIGKVVRSMTRPDDVIVVLGSDWSSEIPYYSERRGILVPAFANGSPESVLRRAQFLARPFEPALVVACNVEPQSGLAAQLEAMRTGPTAEAAGCTLIPIGRE